MQVLPQGNNELALWANSSAISVKLLFTNSISGYTQEFNIIANMLSAMLLEQTFQSHAVMETKFEVIPEEQPPVFTYKVSH